MSSARQSFYRYFLFSTLALTFSCQSFCSHCSGPYRGWGINQSYKQLISRFSSRDYSKTVIDNQSGLLLVAIHGGDIESGTSELIKELFQQLPVNLYLFEGLRAKHYDDKILQSSDMHLTSHKFDDPEIISLARKSNHCLSIHGYPSNKVDICIGGNAQFDIKMQIKKSLKGLNVCIDCCPPYLGRNSKNVVNLCKQKGVQLEMSPNIRRKIMNDKSFRSELARKLAAPLDKLVR